MAKPWINKLSHIPLYRQLVYSMAEQIKSGEMQPGTRIPSEREMAELARVSRTTARQAIEELVATGLVYREQGRGTFVAEPRMRSLMGFASFSEDIIARGKKPTSIILEQQVTPASAVIAKRLKVALDEPVLHLVRLRMADEEPVAVQYSYLPLRLVPGLDKVDLKDKSLFTTLRNEYGVYPVWTEAEVEAIGATPALAEYLQVEPRSPVLLVCGLTYTESFELVESVETYYRGETLALYIGRQRFM